MLFLPLGFECATPRRLPATGTVRMLLLLLLLVVVVVHMLPPVGL